MLNNISYIDKSCLAQKLPCEGGTVSYSVETSRLAITMQLALDE